MCWKSLANEHPLIIGCFQKSWYPQIIHFNRVFHYKPSILGYPNFWKHPINPTNSLATPTASCLLQAWSRMRLATQLPCIAAWKLEVPHSAKGDPTRNCGEATGKRPSEIGNVTVIWCSTVYRGGRWTLRILFWLLFHNGLGLLRFHC